jgi:hypothetical protein
MPLFDSGSLLSRRNVVEDCLEASDAVRWQFDGHAHGIEDPAKDELSRIPVAIPLA